MGLDNIPKNYPCKKNGTAVTVLKSFSDGTTVDQIDCQATQEAGGCPWMNSTPPVEGRVLGMFGTDCWYRGKYGNALLNDAGLGNENDFYGDNEDGNEKSPESCIALAEKIAQYLAHTFPPDLLPTDEALELKADLTYAEWYLRWSAEQADGLVCWY